MVSRVSTKAFRVPTKVSHLSTKAFRVPTKVSHVSTNVLASSIKPARDAIAERASGALSSHQYIIVNSAINKDMNLYISRSCFQS